MVWNTFNSLGFIPPDKYQKQRQRKTSWNPAYFRSHYTALKHGLSRRRKRGCSKLVSGRWNGGYCKLDVWSDRVMKAEVRQRTNVKDFVAVVLCLKWKCGGHGRAQMGTCYINVGRKYRQKENGRAKTRWAGTFKRVSGGQWWRIAKNRCE